MQDITRSAGQGHGNKMRHIVNLDLDGSLAQLRRGQSARAGWFVCARLELSHG